MQSSCLCYSKFRLKSAVRELAFDAIADAMSSYELFRGRSKMGLDFNPDFSYGTDSSALHKITLDTVRVLG
jgi:hypothetical protein